uniref:Mannosyl-glycoprotein endo-beta-N-acetylglucosaminidase n=1 Tax=Macrostomum lignano TaxID=282301 RepID=A0A1I8FHU1_9PLAT
LTQFQRWCTRCRFLATRLRRTASASGGSLDAYSFRTVPRRKSSIQRSLLPPSVSQSLAATVREKPGTDDSWNKFSSNQIPERAGCMAAGSDVRQPSALAPREDLPTSSPRVLVCHDMQGGYLDDAILYGNANASAFRLFHWHLIDSFVYFSHHLVTIPPAGWVWTCATGTVSPVCGTFIAEWDSGLEAMRQLLSNEKTRLGWADRLIDLADAGGFDGWLINVEVALPAELVPALQAFVRRLKSKSSLHIVWYDSVITDGQLLWQNSVNALNEDFLIAAGSILLNYCWTADLLQRQAGGASVIVLFDSNRLCRRRLLRPWLPGGGGFNCSEAVRMIVENQQLGVGLFAPGWAYETCRSAAEPDEADGDAANLWESLVDRTLEFWAGVTPLLGEPRPWAGRRLNTAFCLGQGVCKWDRGRLVSTNAWNSLWEAHPMPHYWLCGAEQHLSLCRSRAWQGGGCLRVALSGGVGGGIGGNGGCELPLFRLSLPARQVRALKLVYSLDSVFEDRPLDPVTVVWLLSTGAHSSSVDSSGGVQSHYSVGSGGGSSQTLVFPRTVRREVEGDVYSEAGGAAGNGGVVWHTVYTEAPTPLWSMAITKTPAMLTKTAYWNSCACFLSCLADWNRLN